VEKTDALLLEDYLEGDIAALGTLFEKYKRMVYRVAIKITKNHEDANDIVQETFLKVYKSIKKFKMDSSFETWLYRVVVNLSLNTVKKRKRRRELLFDDVSDIEITDKDVASTTNELNDFPSSVISKKDEPYEYVKRKELSEVVTQAVDSLPSKQKVVVILHEFEGLTHPEIASILECSVGTVRSRLHYARKKLRELLEPYVQEA